MITFIPVHFCKYFSNISIQVFLEPLIEKTRMYSFTQMHLFVYGCYIYIIGLFNLTQACSGYIWTKTTYSIDTMQ